MNSWRAGILAIALLGAGAPDPHGLRWIQTGTCATIRQADTISTPPLKNASAAIAIGTGDGPDAIYDRTHRLASFTSVESWGYILRDTRGLPAPPPGVRKGDLSGVHLRSGIRIGTPLAKILAMFGNPPVHQSGCGLSYMAYRVDAHGTILHLWLRNGRLFQLGIDAQD